MFRKYLPVAFVILLVAAAVLTVHSKRNRTLHVGIDDFVPSDISQVDKIMLSRKDSHILLEKDGSQWTSNHASTVSPERLNFLLSGLSRLEMVSPVSRTEREAVTITLKGEGTLVELYGRNRRISSFYACYDSLAVKGTCLMKYPSGIPIVVKLVGYPAKDLMELFSTDPARYGQEALFGYLPEEILEVKVDYPEEPDKSYRITRDPNGTLALYGLHASELPLRADQQELADYMNYFGKVNPVHPVGPLSAAMAGQQPFARLTIYVKERPGTDLEAFRYRPPSDPQGKFDKDLYIAVLHDRRDTLLIHYTDTDPLFRQITDFQKN